MNINTFKEELQDYIDFDFLCPLSEKKLKPDGEYYSIYMADFHEKFCTLMPEKRSIILKELTSTQAKIYQLVTTLWSPYLETVFDVLKKDSAFLSISEFIERPSSLDYTKTFFTQRSLSLEDYIKNFGILSETAALIFLDELCEGLSTLYQANIIHHDISPQNVLLTDSFVDNPLFSKIPGIHKQICVKIIDFDITKVQKKENHIVTTICGTDDFAAPEILDYRSPTDRIDIYSLGCLFCYMLTQKSPKQLNDKELSTLLSKSNQELIKKCTNPYQERYPSVKDLQKDIHHHLYVPSNSLDWISYHLPGFRSHTYWKMLLASIGYFFGFALLVFCRINTAWPFIFVILLFLDCCFKMNLKKRRLKDEETDRRNS